MNLVDSRVLSLIYKVRCFLAYLMYVLAVIVIFINTSKHVHIGFEVSTEPKRYYKYTAAGHGIPELDISFNRARVENYLMCTVSDILKNP